MFLGGLCLLKASDFDLAAYVRCPRPALDFNYLNFKFIDSILLCTRPSILNSCLLCVLADTFAILYVILVRSYSIPIFINDKLDPTPQSHCFCYTSYSNNIGCCSHFNLTLQRFSQNSLECFRHTLTESLVNFILIPIISI